MTEEETLKWVETWIDTPVKSVPKHKFAYKLMCFLTFRSKKKLTYKELYILLCNINKNKNIEQEKVQIDAMDQIIKIYKWNNGYKDDK